MESCDFRGIFSFLWVSKVHKSLVLLGRFEHIFERFFEFLTWNRDGRGVRKYRTWWELGNVNLPPVYLQIPCRFPQIPEFRKCVFLNVLLIFRIAADFPSDFPVLPALVFRLRLRCVLSGDNWMLIAFTMLPCGNLFENPYLNFSVLFFEVIHNKH